MICVDTSVWVEALRDATGPRAFHLGELVEADDVGVPAPVLIEVLSGAPRRQFAALVEGFDGMIGLVPGPATWQTVERWVGEAVNAGQRFSVGDLLVAACASEAGARVWSDDADFERMEKLGFIERYVVP